jgi:hypothetical protein
MRRRLGAEIAHGTARTEMIDNAASAAPGAREGIAVEYRIGLASRRR